MRRFQVRFAKQVWPGDMLTCIGHGVGERDEGGEHARRPGLVVTNDRTAPRCSSGTCVVPGGLIMGLLDGRVAVVTGSGRGIGRAYRALRWRPQGAAVVVNDVGATLDGSGQR